MMKYTTHWVLAVITLAILTVIRFIDPYPVELLRLKAFDGYQVYSERKPSETVTVVNIDEQSIAEKGQWPWPRDQIADLIYRLRDANAGIIVMPILFSEPDRAGEDLALAEALQYGVVISQTASARTNDGVGVTRGIAMIGGDPNPWIPQYPGLLAPINILSQNATGVGMIAGTYEIDGVTRRIPMIVSINDTVYPSLALETIRAAVDDQSYQAKVSAGGVVAVRIPAYDTIYTDPYSRVYVNNVYDFNEYSATSEFPDLAGNIVVVGITAEGIGVPLTTPVGLQFAHNVQAQLLETVVNGDTIYRPDTAVLTELAIIVLAGLISILVAYRAVYWLGLPLMLVTVSGGVYSAFYYYQTNLWLYDWTWPLITVTLVYLHAVFNKFIREYLEKMEIKRQFAGYASPTVVRLLQEDPSLIKDGMKKEVSIVFSDLRGFTPLGESFGDDVKGLTKIMNSYMDAITQPILDSDGMVIKYIGDASMHIHNAPINDPQHPRTAVQCGLDMLSAVEKFNEKITSEGRPPVGMGAGINTGLGYLGEMGSTQRHSYDVLGDSVSTAARIESKCKEYGCVLLVGDATYQQTKSDFFYLKIDDLAVKGKSVGVGIWTVLDQRRPAWRVAQRKHEEMHEYYRAQKFDKAIASCNLLHNHFDGKMSGYYDMWIERCEYQKTQDLPKDWNGVFIATSK
jgi:adenylate cyclase